jgi:hypothetical protein
LDGSFRQWSPQPLPKNTVRPRPALIEGAKHKPAFQGRETIACVHAAVSRKVCHSKTESLSGKGPNTSMTVLVSHGLKSIITYNLNPTLVAFGLFFLRLHGHSRSKNISKSLLQLLVEPTLV